MGVLHSFYIKNICYDEMDLRLSYCHVMISNKIVIVYDSVLEICESTFGYFGILIDTSFIIGSNIF